MLELVCIAFPGILSVFFLEKLLKKKMALHDLAATIVLNVLLTNFVVLAYLTFARNGGNFTLFSEPGRIRANTAVLYIVLSCVVSAVLSVSEAFLRTNFDLHLGEEKPEK